MIKMVVWFACVICICGNALFASTEESQRLNTSQHVHSAFGYLDCGLGPFPFPLPNFGIGVRNQCNHNGFDISLNVSTIIALTQAKGSLLYHYYPKPCVHSQFYFGTGIGAGALFFEHKKLNQYECLLSPEIVVGKSYLTDAGDKRFFQMQVSWPTFSFHKFAERGFSDKHSVYFPLVIFSYGIGF